MLPQPKVKNVRVTEYGKDTFSVVVTNQGGLNQGRSSASSASSASFSQAPQQQAFSSRFPAFSAAQLPFQLPTAQQQQPQQTSQQQQSLLAPASSAALASAARTLPMTPALNLANVANRRAIAAEKASHTQSGRQLPIITGESSRNFGEALARMPSAIAAGTAARAQKEQQRQDTLLGQVTGVTPKAAIKPFSSASGPLAGGRRRSHKRSRRVHKRSRRSRSRSRRTHKRTRRSRRTRSRR